MANITLDRIYNALKRKGYMIFEQDDKPFNLNIVGIRNEAGKPNSFDDWVALMWKYKGVWNHIVFEATTDPGLYWLEHPKNPLGTAILKEGQYRGSHAIGLHKGYKALQQVGKLTVIRDYNKDGVIDYSTGKEYTSSNFGINIHRAVYNGKSLAVNKWSAGCQVLADSFQFDQLMDICTEASQYWGARFTYTLINTRDI